MGVPAVEAVSPNRNRPTAWWLESFAFAIFVVLTAITVYSHEPWSDEANSWLLGRDATLVQLWTHLMHYEGTPALWHTILRGLIKLGVPYGALNYFSGALGCTAAWLFIRKAQLPTAVRLLMPFTFYLFFQYSVVARSYCLLPLLLFACASIYSRAKEKLGLITLLLCFMAGVSVHGMILSGSIWLAIHWDLLRQWRTMPATARRKLCLLGATYAAITILMAWSAWPAKDVMFASEHDYSFDHLMDSTRETLGNAFTGEWISALALIVCSVPFLWRGRGLFVFLFAGISLLIFNAYIYANVWHEGMPLLIWLFAMWIAGAGEKPKWIALSGFAAMMAVVGVQGYWAFETTAYDWKNPYSGARETARYLRESGIARTGISGFGFGAVAIQPYFDRNIFPNFRDGEPSAYYDWSEEFRNFSGLDDLPITKPEYVLIGYKDAGDNVLTGREIKRSGYQLIKHFDGDLFWHDDLLEPDAFDLYQRIHQTHQ